MRFYSQEKTEYCLVGNNKHFIHAHTHRHTKISHNNLQIYFGLQQEVYIHILLNLQINMYSYAQYFYCQNILLNS